MKIATAAATLLALLAQASADDCLTKEATAELAEPKAGDVVSVKGEATLKIMYHKVAAVKVMSSISSENGEAEPTIVKEDGKVTVTLPTVEESTDPDPSSASTRLPSIAAAMALGSLQSGRPASAAACGILAMAGFARAECDASAEVTLVLPEGMCAAWEDSKATLIECDSVPAAIALDLDAETTVAGIVTVDNRNSSRSGFFLQMTAAQASVQGVRGVSEGILVRCAEAATCDGVVEGAMVQVAGKRGATEAKQPTVEAASVAVVCKADCGAVNVAELSLPVTELSDFDQYSGMLVAVQQDMTVTGLHELYRGALMLSQGGRIVQETQIMKTGESEELTDAIKAAEESNRRRVLWIDDGSSELCRRPHWMPIGDDSVRVGHVIPKDALAGTAVLTFDNVRFPEWLLVPTEAALESIPASLVRETNPRISELPVATNDAALGRIRVASLNVENFFTDLATTDDCPLCRGAKDKEELERQASKLFAAIEVMDAAVIGLQELQNDGAAIIGLDRTDETATLQYFVTELNKFLGEGKYAFVPVGKVIDYDFTKTCVIYQPALVEPLGTPATLEYLGFIEEPETPDGSRPSFASSFQVKGQDCEESKFTVAVQHLVYKGGRCTNDTDASGRVYGESNCGYARRQHVQQLADWIESSPTGVATDNVLLVGDFNAYRKERAIVYLEETRGYVSLQDRDMAAPQSSAYNGKTGTLDYIFASPAMEARMTEAFGWSCNSDETDLLGFATPYFQPYWFSNAPQSCKDPKPESFRVAGTPWRNSDHDPIVAVFDAKCPVA